MEIAKNALTSSFRKILKRNKNNEASGNDNDDNQLSSVVTTNESFKLRSAFRDPYILPCATTTESSIYLNKDLIKKYCINSCRNFRNALEMFNSPAIKEELKKFRSILYLKFRINGNIHKPNINELKELNEKCRQASVVILISSKSEDDFIIYWKSRDITQLMKLKSYKESFGKDDKDLCEFTAEFLVESLFQGHLGLKSTFKPKPNTSEIEFNTLADSRDFNLLFLAAEVGNINALKALLRTGLKTSIPDTNINIQSIAYENQQFEALLILLQENFPYPSTIDINLCSEEVQEFHKITSNLHKMIKINNLSKINEIISKNPNLRYFYNLSNESALAVALANRSLDTYKLLVTNKIFFGPHEDVDELLQPLGQREKRTLRELNYNYLKSMSERHLNILMAHSLIGSDITDETLARDVMLRAFQVLNQNPITKIILEVVAASSNFQIIFEFNRDSVNVLNPTVEQHTKGLYSTSGKIFIGAKELLDNSTENEAYGTLAHELCHYAMNAVYQNKYHTFQVLNQNPITKIILEVVAASSNFQIIFEFNRDSVNVLNPTVEQHTKGLYSTSGKIFIGAKELLDNSTENEAYGTLAHELCHYAMNAVYQNKARPYLIKCKERFLKFVEICAICEEKSENEPYIELVYSRYPSNVYHAELIVRVPHLVALYHCQPDKLTKVRENFVELFEYYEKEVMPEMEAALPKLREKSEHKIEEIRNERSLAKLRVFGGILVVLMIFVGVFLIAYYFEDVRKLIGRYLS